MWNDAYMNPLGFEELEQKELTAEEAQAAEFEKAAKERYDYCIHMATVFKGPKGKQILKTWRENTIERSAWSPSLANENTLDKANAHAYAREGQNAFVRDIEQCIEIANKCKTLDDFCAMINQLGTANQI